MASSTSEPAHRVQNTPSTTPATQSVPSVVEIFTCGHVRQRTDLLHASLVLSVSPATPLIDYSPTDAATNATWLRSAALSQDPRFVSRCASIHLPHQLSGIPTSTTHNTKSTAPTAATGFAPAMHLYTDGPCSHEICQTLFADRKCAYVEATWTKDDDHKADELRASLDKSVKLFWKLRSSLRTVRPQTFEKAFECQSAAFHATALGGKVFDTFEARTERDAANRPVVVVKFGLESTLEMIVNGTFDVLVGRMTVAAAARGDRVAFEQCRKEAEGILYALRDRVSYIATLVEALLAIQESLTMSGEMWMRDRVTLVACGGDDTFSEVLPSLVDRSGAIFSDSRWDFSIPQIFPRKLQKPELKLLVPSVKGPTPVELGLGPIHEGDLRKAPTSAVLPVNINNLKDTGSLNDPDLELRPSPIRSAAIPSPAWKANKRFIFSWSPRRVGLVKGRKRVAEVLMSAMEDSDAISPKTKIGRIRSTRATKKRKN